MVNTGNASSIGSLFILLRSGGGEGLLEPIPVLVGHILEHSTTQKTSGMEGSTVASQKEGHGLGSQLGWSRACFYTSRSGGFLPQTCCHV